MGAMTAPADHDHERSWGASDLVRTEDVMVPHADVRMRHIHEARRPRLHLNLTAMIDVVFLLLMYFLLIAEFRPREESFDMELPRPPSESSAPDPFALPEAPIRIEVRSLGDEADAFVLSSDSPSIGDVVRGASGLHDRLMALKGTVLGEEQRFVIVAARDARWEHALGVLNALKRAGFNEVRFAEPGP